MLAISGIAIALVLWLTLSFWMDAYVQRKDASRLLLNNEVQDSLFVLLRSLADERLISADPVGANTTTEDNTAPQIDTLAIPRKHFEASQKLVNKLLADDSSVAQLATSAELIRSNLTAVEKQLIKTESLHTAVVQTVDVESNENDYKAIDLWLRAHNRLVNQVESLMRKTHFIPRKTQPPIDALQDLRMRSWNLDNDVSVGLAKISQRTLTPANRADSTALQLFDAREAIAIHWHEVQSALTSSHIPTSVKLAAGQLSSTHYVATGEEDTATAADLYALMSQSHQDERWASGKEARHQLAGFDRLLSQQTNDLASELEAQGFRRLVIDTFLVILCLGLIACAVWISNRLVEATRTELKRSEMVGQLGQAIYTSTDIEDTLSLVCRQLLDLFDASEACVFNAKVGDDLLPSTAWRRDKDGTRAVDIESISLNSNDICYETCETHQVMLNPRDGANKLVGSTACIPLIHNGTAVGVLMARRAPNAQEFSKSDINLLNGLCGQLSTSMHRHGLLNEVKHQANHDALTGLPNRLQFENWLKAEIDKADPDHSEFALVFFNLDGFKTINDTLGHEVGDKVLITVAKRMLGALREGQSLARIGGDEFGLLVNSAEHDEEAEQIASRLIDTLKSVLHIDGLRLQTGTSAGIARFPYDGMTSTELLKHADIALNHAKSQGRGTALGFSKSLAEQYQERVTLETELKKAIKSGSFELAYQPQVCSKSGMVEGVEALIRWPHPELGMIPPFKFIPIAEAGGLIIKIGDWVLDEACRQLAIWQQQGQRDLRIAVNISTQQFAATDFIDKVLDTLERHNIEPQYLELEVTESVMVHDIGEVIDRLNTLREHKILIAIDDFGTGYSSLQYLDKLPVDVLKIDRAFITRLDTVEVQQSLVNTIVLMAQSLGLKTVAEGVESEDQKDKVGGLGCDVIQGYYYSKPLTPDDVPVTIDTIAEQNRQLRKAS